MKVGIPSMLESYTNRQRTVDAQGRTVDELLRDLDRRYPGIRFRLVNEQDEVRPHMRVFVNGTSIHSLATPLDAEDEVVILQALSGG